MDSRLIEPIRPSLKPLLLKDHLLDDMSSCSSNGFKSFPRRQCCTSVRFLHEFDRKTITYVDFRKPPPKSALSALQSVITAVKRLPFGAAKSPEKNKSSINSFLPRSFSKKLFKKGGFWKRKPEHKEIVRWKSFDQLLKEDPEPSNRSCSSITTTDGSKSWSGSDFTASEGGNSASEANSNLPEMIKNDVVVVEMPGEGDDGVGVTNDDVSAESTTSANSSNETKKQWSSDQEKEQFSPVSVLDCPFDDDDDEVSSPFQHRLARMEGTRKKLLKKIQRFECLAKLEPVNLTTRFASHLDSDNESSDSPLPHSEEEDDDADEYEDENEEDEEEKTLELLDQMKESMTSHGLNFKADKLILDFFREGIAIEKQRGCSPLYNELVEIVEDWIDGQKPRDMEWEVEKNRQAYVEEMEKRGEWKRLGQENEEVVLELGNEVFAALLNEVLLDITS